ncbi:hypothetical protein DF053_02145 [Burkholderia cepacia]|nr:hypothetical protein DF053_02145 [Burkholderia cepacia]
MRGNPGRDVGRSPRCSGSRPLYTFAARSIKRPVMASGYLRELDRRPCAVAFTGWMVSGGRTAYAPPNATSELGTYTQTTDNSRYVNSKN